MITKTRKQGNSIMLTVPKEFDVPNGVEVEAKLVENGILYPELFIGFQKTP
jgi:antitoxin component of MazEF toxin-antitoxin module